jgi:class 3 adenylate cyclase
LPEKTWFAADPECPERERMKLAGHVKSILKFWKSSVSRKMTFYFMIFGILIFYATSVLYLMVFRQSLVTSINHMIHSQFRQLESKNESDFIWHSINTFRPDIFGILNALIHIAPDLYSIHDISIYCRVAENGKWHRLYFENDQVIHVEPAADEFLEKHYRSMGLPLIISNFHFFITREDLSLFYDITGEKDQNRYFLKVRVKHQGIGGILKVLGIHMLTIYLILLFLTRLLGYLFSRKLAKPIEILSRGVALVADGNLSAKIAVTSRDEIGLLADNFNKMIEGLRERDFIKETFGKYVTREIRDEILKGNIPLDGEIKRVTVLFADLRNFTRLSEKTPPKEMAKIINGYFTEMAEAIHNQKGLVLQFIGDEIEAVFGAPLPLEDHPIKAVEAALEMRERLNTVNRRLAQQGIPGIAHGIGIHTGEVLAATIGSPDRLSYTLIGDTVNLASRIQELNKDFATDILISEATRSGLKNRFPLKKIEQTAIRGKEEIVALYQVL